MCSCTSCEAADYSHKALKNFGWYYTFEACPCKVCHWNLGPLRVHLLAIYTSQLLKAQINSVCSQMSITAHKLCHQDHQTCTKSKSSWSTRCGISCMDIYIYHTHSENNMICIIHTWQVKEELQHAGNTDACSSDQTFSRGLIKTPRNLDHLKKSDVHGS